MRALSHTVRTPLSVVQNDLSYFASVKSALPPEEYTRGIERCRQISELLRTATPLPLSPPNKCEVSGHGPSVLAHHDRLVWLIAELRSLTSESSGTTSEMTVQSKDTVVSLNFGAAGNTSKAHGDWDSLSAFYSEALGLDKLSAPLLDAYVWAIDGSILLSSEPTHFRITVNLPSA